MTATDHAWFAARLIAYHDLVVCPGGYCTDDLMTYPTPPDDWQPDRKASA